MLFDFFYVLDRGCNPGWCWARCFLNWAHSLCHQRPIVAQRRNKGGVLLKYWTWIPHKAERAVLGFGNQGDKVRGLDVVGQERSPSRIAGLWPALAPSLPGLVVESQTLSRERAAWTRAGLPISSASQQRAGPPWDGEQASHPTSPPAPTHPTPAGSQNPTTFKCVLIALAVF